MQSLSSGRFLACLLFLWGLWATPASSAVLVNHQVTDLGASLYRYDFFVSGSILQDQELAIFFPQTNVVAGSLLNEIFPAAQWASTVLQPDPGLPDDGIWSLVSAANQAAITGVFSIELTWTGLPLPGSLAFTVSDTVPSFNTIQAGFTTAVPEPATLSLWLAAGLALGLSYRREPRR